MRLEAETAHFYLYELKFPTARPSRFEANNTVWGHLYLPRGVKNPPCVLVLPIMAAPNVWIEERFVREFVRYGYAAMWIEMPYQFHRRPDPLIPSGQVFLSRTAQGLGRNFRQSVADARRAITMLERSGLVDSERIGIFGISLGAMVGSAVYSKDERPVGAVFLLGGADFPDLVFRSGMTREFAQLAGIRPSEVRREWKGFDPLEYRESNRDKRVFLVNARRDRIIPRENAEQLLLAFPRGEQIWVPGGHYTAIAHMLWMPSYAAAKFRELFLRGAAEGS